MGRENDPGWVSALMPFTFLGGRPHLSLPYNHVVVFSLLQDSERHVSLQLIKHLWENQDPQN